MGLYRNPAGRDQPHALPPHAARTGGEGMSLDDLTIGQKLYLFVESPSKVGKRTWKPSRVSTYKVIEISHQSNSVLIGMGSKSWWKTQRELQRFLKTDPRTSTEVKL